MQIIVSGSQDNTIKFWNLKTGECLKTLAIPRPYEGSNSVGVTGLTESQKTSLKLLGAVETKEIRGVAHPRNSYVAYPPKGGGNKYSKPSRSQKFI